MSLSKRSDRRLMIGAALWAFCLQFFIAEQLVRLRWTLPYSFTRNFVSDLGVTACSSYVCSPWHALMNGSFLLQGLLITGGAVLTWRRWSGLGRIGMSLLILCGVGVVIVGLVPEDFNGVLHRLGAAFHFLGGGSGMLAAGASLPRRLGWLSIATGILVLAATLALSQGGKAWVEDLGPGAIERVAAYGIAGWMVVLGAWLLWQISPPKIGR